MHHKPSRLAESEVGHQQKDEEEGAGLSGPLGSTREHGWPHGLGQHGTHIAECGGSWVPDSWAGFR